MEAKIRYFIVFLISVIFLISIITVNGMIHSRTKPKIIEKLVFVPGNCPIISPKIIRIPPKTIIKKIVVEKIVYKQQYPYNKHRPLKYSMSLLGGFIPDDLKHHFPSDYNAIVGIGILFRYKNYFGGPSILSNRGVLLTLGYEF